MVSRRIISLSLVLASAGWPPAHASGTEPRTLKAPNVVLGPSEVEAAPRIEAAIREVTVFSDRARVRRRGRAALKAGASVLRLPDLPGAAFLDTIHVSATGARVVRVEATPVEHDRLEIGQAVKLLDELDAADDHAAELADKAALEQWEIDLLTRLAPEPQVPEEKREGRKGVALDVGSWWKALDFIAARTRAARERLVTLEHDRRKLDDRRDTLRADIAKLDQGGFSGHAVEVVVVLETGEAASAEVQLEYFVPAASWKPSYDLHFSTARGQARLETAAVVAQATGEDWPESALSFSTAMPGRGIDLPELLTWTLGERSEFVPRPRARAAPPAEPLYPPPDEPDALSPARAVELEALRQRLAMAKRPAPTSVVSGEGGEGAVKGEVDEDMAVAGLLRGGGRGYDQRSVQSSRATGRAQAIESAAADDVAEVSAKPRLHLAKRLASPERLSAPSGEMRMEGDENPLEEAEGKVSRLRAHGDDEASEVVSPPAPAPAPAAPAPPPVRRVPLALYDVPPRSEKPRLADPYLPAVSAGGFDFVYRTPAPVAVPSTGKQIRIPLASQTFRTTAYYQATPALADTAFLHARVRNDGTRPLLRGPVAIFGDGELVGVGEIRTTGPWGDIELPLGADQDVRVVRQVVPTTKTTGVMFKSDETTYDVQIQIGNYKKQPITVEVTDQVPRSRTDKVAVKLLDSDPKPIGEIDLDGTVRFRVEVAAGATRTVKLRYQITRPHDWELYQR
jgi:hypothetical protein